MKTKATQALLILTICLIISASALSEELPEHCIARLGKGAAGQVIFSPDGKFFAIGSSLGVWLYDQNFAEIALLEHENSSICAFSSDSKLLASGRGNKVFLWDVASQQKIEVIEDFDYLTLKTINFSPNGELIAIGGYKPRPGSCPLICPIGVIKLWDITLQKQISVIEEAEEWGCALSATFSPNGKNLFWVGQKCSGETVICSLNTSSQEKSYIASSYNPMHSLAVSHDGKWLAWHDRAWIDQFGEKRDTTVLWDVEQQAAIALRPVSSMSTGRSGFGHHDPGYSALAFSSDGKWLASGLNEPTVWDVASQEIIFTLDQAGVSSVAFHPNNNWLSLGGAEMVFPPTKEFISVWDITSQKKVIEFPEYMNSIVNMDIDCVFINENESITGGAQGLSLWDTTAGKITLFKKCPWVIHLSYSSEKELLAVSSIYEGRRVILFDAFLNEIAIWEGVDAMGGLVLSRDGEMLVTSNMSVTPGIGHKLHFWDVAKQKKIGVVTLKRKHQDYTTMAISPDKQWLAVGGTVPQIVDIALQKDLPVLAQAPEDINDLSFSPDGKWLALASREYKTLQIWDTTLWKQVAAVKNGKQFSSALFNPNAKSIAISTGPNTYFYDATLASWEKALQKEIATLQGCYGSSLAFSPNGALLTSVNTNTILVWDIPIPPSPTHRIGDLTGDDMISGLDGTYIMQYFTGQRTFTAEQKRVADVSDDGRITPHDAKLIGQYVVGSITEFPKK